MWLTLLTRDIGRSSVVYDDLQPRRVLAFGIAAPIKQMRFDRMLGQRAAFVARSLLDEWTVDRSPFLDESEYAAENASAGLNVIVLHNGICEDLEISELPNVLMRLSESFVSDYAGCRLRAVLHEAFGVPRRIAVDVGSQLVEYAQPPDLWSTRCPVDREPFVMLATRALAERHPGNLMLNALFLRFTAPRLSFRPVERRLLRFALDGEDDARIADLLAIAPRTLKRRWADIYLSMEALTGVSSGGNDGRRGVEIRRSVLRYVRQHTEELHPYRRLESSGRNT